MHTFDTHGPISTVLEIPAGRIHLLADDRTETAVEVRPTDPGRSRDVRAVERTTVAYADGVLRIQNPEPRHQAFGSSGSVEVTVRLPVGSRVEGRSGGCALRGVGRLGHVVFEGAYREINVGEAASLRLTAVDGDVVVGRLGGPGEISTARGDIRIDEALGGGTLKLTTRMGDITVGAAAGVSASLDAGTGRGRISNALKNDGTPVLDIRATTTHGDITARSL
ncbi:DUF4097 domain-containing protein [Kitasatospora sp. RB6PN24]|uniref:DUF4097 family beta strand repeat-containing protein n=1 Tax=Kitasatospora humi TaxID=2893891 RepID=UPI001E45FE9F|nr:DUF4097 family beta strand repeat-containing protein [Kitasatospora humi]MCC9311859.1 DUF4097 domain-containing protein [Kitasatospora humi]